METVDAAFVRRARASADRVAVSASTGDMTYAELDARTSQFAQYLIERGVRPGDIVGIRMQRSAATVIALLAALKAGAAYLALDDRQPTERQRLILADASARVLVADDASADAFADAWPVVCMDQTLPEVPAPAPAARGGPLSLAYVAYTSGSTGVPKGVCVPHQGVLRLVADPAILPIGEDDVVLHYAPVSFDASTFEIWGALLNGARLAVAPPGGLSLPALLSHIHAERVTIAWLTSGLFHQAVDLGLERLGHLRFLLAGGDTLSPSHVDRARVALPRTTLINGYGPTENTTFTCCHTVDGPVGPGSVPIGRPIRGTGVYILDDALRPVADGDVGELYATGLGLAHGYIASPALTATRFVADPFAAGGARMYRTGDFVRRRPDGALEFVGRRDGQVKIRGFRVETDEVLAALQEQPGVTHAAVVVKGNTPADRRIVAYVTADRSALAIRERLAQRLPDYAVPSLIRTLEAMPLTASGKVDRTALERLPEAERPDVRAAYRPPDSRLEAAMVDLWSDLLGVVGIGADDDFFELGGHSLLAIGILREVRAAHGVDVSPIDFYLASTPAGLARVITKAGNGA